MTFKLVYYRAAVSSTNVALLSCMYVLLCKFILITVQINIHSFVQTAGFCCIRTKILIY